MKYAAVYIPEFPVATWLRAQPEICEKAAVVLEGNAPLEHVYSRNHASEKLGIAHGMSKVQAETFGNAWFEKRAMARELEAYAEVIKIAEGFPRGWKLLLPQQMVIKVRGCRQPVFCLTGAVQTS